MPKKKTKPQLMNQAAELLQKLRRLEEADDLGYVSCVTCGITRKWNDQMQGGHWISRRYTGTKLDERNVWPQCNGCNGPGGGRPDEYAIWLLNIYDDGQEIMEEMLQKKHHPKKYMRYELEELIESYKERIKKELERVGG